MAWSATADKQIIAGLRSVVITYTDDSGALPTVAEQFPINATTNQDYIESRVANKISEFNGQDAVWETIIPGPVNPKPQDSEAKIQFQQDFQKLQYLQVLVNSGALDSTDKVYTDLQAKVKAAFDPTTIGLEAIAVKP